jgi:hypothetical protein
LPFESGQREITIWSLKTRGCPDQKCQGYECLHAEAKLQTILQAGLDFSRQRSQIFDHASQVFSSPKSVEFIFQKQIAVNQNEKKTDFSRRGFPPISALNEKLRLELGR